MEMITEGLIVKYTDTLKAEIKSVLTIITTAIDNEEEMDYESNCIIMESESNEGTPSAEILITTPKNKGHKQYKTYLGLVDIGT
jgi:hypothetical protein